MFYIQRLSFRRLKKITSLPFVGSLLLLVIYCCAFITINLPCSSYNRDGSIYAYAISYDWSRGYADYNPSIMKNTILLHGMNPDEQKAKPKAK
mgnify:FL=1